MSDGWGRLNDYAWEVEAKGALWDAVVRTKGKSSPVAFYDPVRLQQRQGNGPAGTSLVSMNIKWPIVLFLPDSAESFHSSEDLETSGEPVVVEGHRVAFDRALRRLLIERVGERYVARVVSDEREDENFVHHALPVLEKLQRHLRGRNRARLLIPNVESLSPDDLFDALVMRLG